MGLFDYNLLQDSWFVLGLATVVGLPILLVILNEVIRRVERRNVSLTRPLRTFHNVILPMMVGILVLRVVLNFTADAISIKILETALWILIINSAITVINILFFSSSHVDDGEEHVPQLFLDIFRVVVVLVGVAIVFSTVWGADLGNLITALGLGSFVLGLALQDTLGNLFSGIALVYEKPFAEGDIIEVNGKRGKVIEMNWRSVRILTKTEEMIIIPHLVIGQGEVINFSRPHRFHVIEIVLGFSYRNPPNLVKKILMNTCLTTPGILHDPEPYVSTVEYNASSIDYEVEFAIFDYSELQVVKDRFLSRIWYTAYRSGLEIPYPQQVMHRASEMVSVEEANQIRLGKAISVLPKILTIR